MRLCWQFNPKMRPSFPEIIGSVEEELQPSFRDLSFFYNQATHTDTPPTPAPSLAQSPQTPGSAPSTPAPPASTADIQPAANGETGAGLRLPSPEELPSYAHMNGRKNNC